MDSSSNSKNCKNFRLLVCTLLIFCSLFLMLFGNRVEVNTKYAGDYFIDGEKIFAVGNLTALDSYHFFIQTNSETEITVSILNVPRDEKVVLRSFSGNSIEYLVNPYGPTEYWLRIQSNQPINVAFICDVNHYSLEGTFFGGGLLFISMFLWIKQFTTKASKKELMNNSKKHLLISVVIILTIFSVAFLARFSIQDFPIKNDEFGYGRFLGHIDESLFIKSQFDSGSTFENYITNFVGHPTMIRYLIAGFLIVFPSWPVIAAAHFPIAIISSLTCVIVYYLGKDLFDQRVGICAAIFLAFSPFFINYGQSTYLYEPLSFFMSLSLFAVFRGVIFNNSPYILLSSVSCGLALGIHEYGSLLLPIVGLWFIFLYIFSYFKNKKIKLCLPRNREIHLFLFKTKYVDTFVNFISLKKYLIFLVTFFLISLGVYVLSFPWIWPNPIERAIKIFGTYAHQSTTGHPIYYLGKVWIEGPPFYSVATYMLAFETPAMVITFVLGIISIIRELCTRESGVNSILLLSWFGFIFLFFSFTMLKLVPHIAVFYPPFALISGLGLVKLAETINQLLDKAL